MGSSCARVQRGAMPKATSRCDVRRGTSGTCRSGTPGQRHRTRGRSHASTAAPSVQAGSRTLHGPLGRRPQTSHSTRRTHRAPVERWLTRAAGQVRAASPPPTPVVSYPSSRAMRQRRQEQPRAPPKQSVAGGHTQRPKAGVQRAWRASFWRAPPTSPGPRPAQKGIFQQALRCASRAQR